MTTYTNVADPIACYPASSEQVQSWNYHTKLGPGNPHQVLSLETHLEYPDARVMEEALAWLVGRHESLRTFFRRSGEVLHQCVVPYDAAIFSMEQYDLRDETDSAGFILEKTAHIWRKLRDIDQPPLFRSCLFRLPGGGSLFSFHIHHLISDEWSKSVIYRELSLCYNALKKGEPVPTEPPGMQLRDYASWQRQWLAEKSGIIRTYWMDKLAGLDSSCCKDRLYDFFPTAGRDPVKGGLIRKRDELLQTLDDAPGAVYAYYIRTPLYDELRRFAIHCEAGMSSIVNASLRLLYFVLAGRTKILVSMPVINRNRPGTATLIGCMGGAIYLYQALMPDMSIKELIRESYLEFLQSARYLIYDHDEMGLDGLALRLHCDVFVNFVSKEVMGVLGNGKLPPREGLQHLPTGAPEFYSLTFGVSEFDDGLSCTWKYNSVLYTAPMIDTMREQHTILLQAMCKNPDMKVTKLLRYLKTTYTNGTYPQENTFDL